MRMIPYLTHSKGDLATMREEQGFKSQRFVAPGHDTINLLESSHQTLSLRILAGHGLRHFANR